MTWNHRDDKEEDDERMSWLRRRTQALKLRYQHFDAAMLFFVSRSDLIWTRGRGMESSANVSQLVWQTKELELL